MKNINVFYINDISFIKDIINSKTNSLVSIEEEYDKYFICNFNSKIDGQSKIKISLINLFDVFENNNPNVILDKLLEKLLNISLATAKNINSEPIEVKKDSIASILAVIKSKINKYYSYSYGNNILYLCSEIFFEILNIHALINGNKRFAFSILIEILYYFGFYFKYTKGTIKNYDYNKDKIANFVIDYQNNKDKEKSIHSIYEWILENILIALNFSK